MSSKKPSLFVGSSGKSLEIAKRLKAGLKGIASVTLWSEHPEFQRAGKIFLPVLLEQPERFDFAVMVFGPDDLIKTDKGIIEAPRDNVVFELGLFMSQLDTGRTFVLYAEGIKILSDIQGLIRIPYDPKSGPKSTIKRISTAIRETTDEQTRRRVMAHNGPRNPNEFQKALLDEIARRWKRGEHVRVDNFALDMEATWGPLRDKLKDRRTKKLTWRSLMLDPDWAGFKKYETDSFSIDTAKANRRNMQSFLKAHESKLKKRKVTFECQKYRSLPLIHGFLVNDSFLLMTLLKRRQDGRLEADNNSYLRFPLRNETNEHFIQVYSNSFKYEWNNSKPLIAPPPKVRR